MMYIRTSMIVLPCLSENRESPTYGQQCQIRDSQMKNYFHIRVVSQFDTKQRRLMTSPFEILLK